MTYIYIYISSGLRPPLWSVTLAPEGKQTAANKQNAAPANFQIPSLPRRAYGVLCPKNAGAM